MNTTTAIPVLYEIKVNPFRYEHAIAKSESDISKLRLHDHVLIQIYKEILFGQITQIKNVSYPLTDIKCHILRVTDESDLIRRESLHKKNVEIKIFFEHLLKQFKLLGKVIFIDWDYNQHKVYCYLTSERKINYLLLYETAVDTLKTRVAIKQIGARDYARSIGGLGVCGRELCCCVFLHNLQSVTLRMARKQSLYIEPEKLSGTCGKLQCCIAFESLYSLR